MIHNHSRRQTLQTVSVTALSREFLQNPSSRVPVFEFITAAVESRWMIVPSMATGERDSFWELAAKFLILD